MENRKTVLLLLMFALSLKAMASDAEAPLTVDADSMEADRAREISVFQGDVRIDKGGIHIEAQEARLRASEGEVQEGTLIGSPVVFRQEPEEGDVITGEAQRIEYDAVNRIVILTGKAWVKQGSDEFRGETIRYDLDGRKVLATSNKSTPERVRLIFQPKEQETTPPTAADEQGNN